MPRLHSASHYHSHPSSRQSAPSTPLLHSNPRHPSYKSRPATPLHSQAQLCSSNRTPRSASDQLKQSHPSSSALMPSNPLSGSKRPTKPTSDSPTINRHRAHHDQLSTNQAVSQLLLTPKPNRKVTPKRSRKTRDKVSSTSLVRSTSHLYDPSSFSEPPLSSTDLLDQHTHDCSPTPRHADSLELGKPHHALSLYDFCDQLSVKIHDRSLEVIPCPPSKTSRSTKKKIFNRKTQKGPKRSTQICTQSSDCEDILTFDHSIFISNDHPSRSTTPSPIKLTSEPNSHAHHTALALSDDPQPLSHRKSSITLPSSPVFNPRRRHIRAKSVASIFDTEKRSAFKSCDIKDDWDMPTVIASRDLTWQQKEKKSVKTSPPASTPSHLTQKLAQHTSYSPAEVLINQNSKDSSSRRQRSCLARTSSAGVLAPLIKSSSAPKPVQSCPYRSDDESPLTWQQSILRPLSKNCPHVSRPEKSDISDPKSGNKRNSTLPVTFKTPAKSACNPRKVGVSSANKPKTSPVQSATNKRRNSLSSGQVPHSKLTEAVFPKGALSLAGHDVPEWDSFSSSPANISFECPSFLSLPIAGAPSAPTSQRRHAKSYTEQPVALSTRSIHPTNHLASLPILLDIPGRQDLKIMTPSKSRTTSEDLNLATPGNKLETSALRAAIMYAGPQFHNSPCPAALPAPKFSFGSA